MQLLPSSSCVNSTIRVNHIDAVKAYREKTGQEYYKLYWTNPGRNLPQNSSCMATYLSSLNISKQDMQDTTGKVRKWCSPMDLFIQTCKMLEDQQELIYNSSVWTQNVMQKTCQKWWMIEMNGESGNSMLVGHDE